MIGRPEWKLSFSHRAHWRSQGDALSGRAFADPNTNDFLTFSIGVGSGPQLLVTFRINFFSGPDLRRNGNRGGLQGLAFLVETQTLSVQINRKAGLRGS